MSPAPAIAIVGAGAAFVAGRTLARRFPVMVPAVVACGAAALAVVTAWRGSLLDTEHGPFGYANATAAFFVVGAAAALLVHLRATDRVSRAVSAVTVLAFGTIPLVVGSRAGALGAAVVALGLVPTVHRRDRGQLARTGWSAVVVVVGATVVAALAWDPGQRADELGAFTRWAIAGRVELWHKAVSLLRAEPLLGVGAGAFGAAGEPATYAFQRYAHSDYLQAGAELGVGAILLALATVTWLFWRSTDDDTAAGVLLLTAVGIHLAVDYVGQFPLVLASAAAIVGASAARVTTPEPEVVR